MLLAWLSPRWHTRDKAFATLLPILGVFLLLSSTFAARVSFGAEPTITVVRVVESIEPRSQVPMPQAPVNSGPPVWQQILAMEIALFGLIGSPWTAAVYLAMRIRPQTRPALAVVAGVGAFVVVFALFAALALPLGMASPRAGTTAPAEVQETFVAVGQN